MVLSKALKAKILSIPSEVASLSTPGCERPEKPPSGLRLTTRRGDGPMRMGPIRGPSQWLCGLRDASSALSLSREEGRSTFRGVVGILAKF